MNTKLSKAQLITLGMISDAPLHVYAMQDILKFMFVEKWGRISAVSIYKAIERLAKLEFLTINEEKVGNMPTRKVCTITAEGRDRLVEMLKRALVESEPEDNAFRIAVSFAWALKTKEFKECLNARLEGLKAKSEEFKKVRDNVKDLEIDHAVIMMSNGVSHLDVQITMVQELIALVEKDPKYFQKLHKRVKQRVMQKS